MKQPSKPPIHREHVMGDDSDAGPGHVNKVKLDPGGMGKQKNTGGTLRAAMKAIPKV